MLRPSALAPLAALALLLSGCSSAPEAPTSPSPKPSASQLEAFESDDEAFEAATAALSAYLEVVNEARQTGVIDREELLSVSLQAAADEAAVSIEKYADAGQRQVGDIRFDSAQYESSYGEADSLLVAINVCMDYSERSVVDAHGQEVDLSQVDERAAFRVELSNAESEDLTTLKMRGIESWPERSCS
ncbi:hypothetical protein OH146_11030 [Salinibacterium sp. SYSU T00001]|uniref:hypothetical protein n=1 Tax=Homoserinimonas sedimenticola TaxID=2986805 RepID=UPI002235FDB1|nr:hypothetical protein [Salinibacterium sedimenticola]MCW4386305.1 hypothetical protein [Salinibacterium sedimenticola]